MLARAESMLPVGDYACEVKWEGFPRHRLDGRRASCPRLPRLEHRACWTHSCPTGDAGARDDGESRAFPRQGADKLRPYAFIVRLSVLGALVLTSVFMADWKWGGKGA